MVLIGLLYKRFIDNLHNFPNHLSQVCKRDASIIRSIIFGYEFSGAHLTSASTIDLSKLNNLSEFNLISFNIATKSIQM